MILNEQHLYHNGNILEGSLKEDDDVLHFEAHVKEC